MPPKYKFKIGTPKTNPWIKALIYGPSGVGKTTLVGSAEDVPEMQNTLFVDAESGSKSLLGWPSMDLVQINKFMQLAQIHDHMRLHCAARDAGDTATLKRLEEDLLESERDDPKVYRTLVIDSLSEIQRLNMYQLLNIEIGKTPIDDIPDAPEFKEWNQTTNMVRFLVRNLRDLPMHVLMVASEKLEDERRGLVTIDFPEQLSRTLPYFFDIVGYMETAQVTDDRGNKVIKRRLNVVRTKTYVAKHRFGPSFGDRTFIEEPTMKKLYELNSIGSTNN